MLDLTQKNTLNIKLSKRKTLHILPPTKRLYDSLIALYNDPDNSDKVNEVVASVLSNNTSHKNFKIKYVAKLHESDVTAILEAYAEFINQIKQSPN